MRRGLRTSLARRSPSYSYWTHFRHDHTQHVESCHFCSHRSKGFHRCVIYDSDAPNTRLICIEYIVSERVTVAFGQRFVRCADFQVTPRRGIGIHTSMRLVIKLVSPPSSDACHCQVESRGKLWWCTGESFYPLLDERRCSNCCERHS
ncbi:hypothetical protein EV702DRAFT_1066226 [Suillus placidus]|uniref:Uncharacterized protein n=1 Tax=Suillus placidus TaxID=48579 RepID=A0A9P7A6P5_9AGAM|nr:hypothetical protein EV702DRAFT_1066226 [Suillus placidus]